MAVEDADSAGLPAEPSADVPSKPAKKAAVPTASPQLASGDAEVRLPATVSTVRAETGMIDGAAPSDVRHRYSTLFFFADSLFCCFCLGDAPSSITCVLRILGGLKP